MLIEIHLLQNHSPGNPNRDDVGAPKSAYFGGRLRGRISSQCIKRSIRWFQPFRDELAGHLGERTMLFPHLVGERLKKKGCMIPIEDHPQIVAACSRIAKAKDKKNKQTKPEKEKRADTRPRTPQLIYFSPGEMDEFVERLERLRNLAEMRDAYAYYLNLVAGFEELMASAAEDSDFEEDDKKKLVKNAWVIAKLRRQRLTRFEWEEEEQSPPSEDGGEPGEAEAGWIVARIDALSRRDDNMSKKVLREILKAPSTAEKSRLQLPDEPKGYKTFRDQLLKPLVSRSVDIALFGRMTTGDAFENVEACLEVAHAISTNEMVREVDYFTAMDDHGTGAAAAYVSPDGNQFTSCTYYKYFSLDWREFRKKLTGPNPTQKDQTDADTLARKAVRALIHATVHAVPTGKKKGHANNNVPDAVLVEIKEKRIPTSYANAFLKPVVPPAESDLLKESKRRLGHYVGLVSTGYALNPQRFWFDLHQEPLAITHKGGDNQPPKPETLAASLPSFDALLDAVDLTLAAAGGER